MYGTLPQADEVAPLPQESKLAQRAPYLAVVAICFVSALYAAPLQSAALQDRVANMGTLDLDDDDPYLTETDECSFNCGGASLEFPEEGELGRWGVRLIWERELDWVAE